MNPYPKHVDFPFYLNECAALIGPLRNNANTQLCHDQPKFVRPDYVNINGVLGELIAQHICYVEKKDYIAAPLVSSTPIRGPDITIGNFKFDVKAHLPTATALTVNQDSHLKDKNISHYWLFHLLSPTTARYWIFPYSIVSNWPVKNCKYSPAYHFPIPHFSQPPWIDSSFSLTASCEG